MSDYTKNTAPESSLQDLAAFLSTELSLTRRPNGSMRGQNSNKSPTTSVKAQDEKDTFDVEFAPKRSINNNRVVDTSHLSPTNLSPKRRRDYMNGSLSSMDTLETSNLQRYVLDGSDTSPRFNPQSMILMEESVSSIETIQASNLHQQQQQGRNSGVFKLHDFTMFNKSEESGCSYDDSFLLPSRALVGEPTQRRSGTNKAA